MHHDNIGKANDARDRLHLAHEIEGRRNQKQRVAVGDGAQPGLGRATLVPPPGPVLDHERLAELFRRAP